jgi:hypothetical protein
VALLDSLAPSVLHRRHFLAVPLDLQDPLVPYVLLLLLAQLVLTVLQAPLVPADLWVLEHHPARL